MSEDQCSASWQASLVGGNSLPSLAALLIVGWLVVSKLKEWEIFYHVKLFLEYLFIPVPLIDVEMSPEEALDDGVKGEPSNSIDLVNKKRRGFIQCYDPSTHQYLGEAVAMTKGDVHDLCQRAAEAQKSWAKTTFAQRRQVLRTIQKYVVHHVEDICRVASRDSGKPKVDALLGEVLTTCEKIRTINQWGEVWLRRSYRPTGPLMMHKKAYVEYVPFGVIGSKCRQEIPKRARNAISLKNVICIYSYCSLELCMCHRTCVSKTETTVKKFNNLSHHFPYPCCAQPFHNMINHIISGIFAGNAVVGKVSEHTSWSAAYFGRIVQKALTEHGHNPDLCQTITGFGEAGAALVSDPCIDKVIFTGSPAIGKKVMETASHHLKPVILELGGKDVMVIMDDCKVKEVVPWILRGCYQNCGQNCVGVERVMIYESLHDELVAALQARVENLRQGIPQETCGSTADVDCGSMVMDAQCDLIQSLIDDAVKKGAKVLTGGKRAAMKGNFYEPTIVIGVTPEMRLFQEEAFGPVMTVIKVPNDSDTECLKMINSTPFGLGSSVYSSNQARALALGNQIRSGMLTVNDFGSNYLVQVRMKVGVSSFLVSIAVTVFIA